MWRGRTELKVYFMGSDLQRWKVDRSPMTPEVILGWAAEWNSELAKAIPRFARVDSADEADIRIAFRSKWLHVTLHVHVVVKPKPHYM